MGDTMQPAKFIAQYIFSLRPVLIAGPGDIPVLKHMNETYGQISYFVKGAAPEGWVELYTVEGEKVLRECAAHYSSDNHHVGSHG